MLQATLLDILLSRCAESGAGGITFKDLVNCLYAGDHRHEDHFRGHLRNLMEELKDHLGKGGGAPAKRVVASLRSWSNHGTHRMGFLACSEIKREEPTAPAQPVGSDVVRTAIASGAARQSQRDDLYRAAQSAVMTHDARDIPGIVTTLLAFLSNDLSTPIPDGSLARLALVMEIAGVPHGEIAKRLGVTDKDVTHLLEKAKSAMLHTKKEDEQP